MSLIKTTPATLNDKYLGILERLLKHDKSDVGDIIYIATKLAEAEMASLELSFTEEEKGKLYAVRAYITPELEELRSFCEKALKLPESTVAEAEKPKPKKAKAKKKTEEANVAEFASPATNTAALSPLLA